MLKPPILIQSPPVWLIYLIWVLGISFLVFLIFVIGLSVWLWFSAKEEVEKTPREPMLICDIHGMYPAKYSMHIEVPGMELPSDLCPFCIDERVSKKKVL